MNFKEMIDDDLKACFDNQEFSIVALHYFASEDEELNIFFDEKTDVILEQGEYAGVETTVPSFQIASFKAININHKSLFSINEENFGVIEVHKENDGTTKVYLDRQ